MRNTAEDFQPSGRGGAYVMNAGEHRSDRWAKNRYPLLGPLDRNLMVASVGLHRALVIVRPLREDSLVIIGTPPLPGRSRRPARAGTAPTDSRGGQGGQNSDTQTIAGLQKGVQKLHRSPSLSCQINKIIGETTTDGIKISNIYGYPTSRY